MTTGLFSVFTVLATLLLLACGIALLPALFVIGAIVLALSLAAAVLGLVFRLLGFLLVIAVAAPLFIACALALVVAVAILHAALPVLLVVGIVWLIVRHQRAQPVVTPRAY
jgi:hypothetical protein